jgi:Sugar kinases, ribokinase family
MIDIVSVGHICVDITPGIPESAGGIQDIFVGGKLVNLQNLSISTGGSVSNTGITLNRLGIQTPLVAKIGNDILGEFIKKFIMDKGGNCDNIIISDHEATSCTIVIAVPGVDRIFLHNPAVNDTFSVRDIDFELIGNAKIMHFGYPTLLRRMHINGGAEFIEVLKKSKETHVTTSVDITLPDPSSESACVDWELVLTNAMPYIDIFMPSIEEIIFMLDKKEYQRLKAISDDILPLIDIHYISRLGQRVIQMGAKIVAFKCGELGFYLTTADVKALNQMGRGMVHNPDAWGNKEIFSSTYTVENVISATGAGDTCIAGFLAGLVRGMPPEDCINLACGAGAICVSEYGAVDGIEHMDVIMKKVKDGWPKKKINILDKEGFLKQSRGGIAILE